MPTARDPEPFIGRRQELEILSSALDRAQKGTGAIVTVSGEPGIGKTSLARQATDRAITSGFITGMGRCREQRDAPPFWPWLQSVRAARREAGEAKGPLSVAIEQLAREQHDLDTSLFAVFQDTLEPLRSACSMKPMLLVIDDLQWSDAASIELLEFAVPELETMPLVIIATMRDNEVRQNQRLVDALTSLSREPAYTDIHLGGLSEDEVGQLLERVSGDQASEENADRLHAVSGGNPFFVREIGTRSGREVVEPLMTTGDGPVPESIKRMVERRMAWLPLESRQILQSASLIGETFDLDLLRRVSGASDTVSVIDALQPAEEQGLVHAEDSGTWRFHHAITRHALSDSIRGTTRLHMHLEIAQALESAESSNEHTAELAYHYEQAQALSGPEPVFKYSLAAGLQAIRNLAFVDAYDHLVKAEKLLPEKGTRDEAELLDGLCLSHMSTVRNDMAFMYQIRAFEAWMALGEPERALRSATHPIPGGGGPDTTPMTERALELAEPGSLLRALLLSRSGWLGGGLPAKRALARFTEALEIVKKHAAPNIEMWLRGRMGGGQATQLRYEESIEELQRAIALAPLARDPEAEVHCHFWVVLASGTIGRVQDIENHIAACKQAARRSRSLMRMYQWARTEIFIASLQGDYARLDSVYEDAAQFSERAKENFLVYMITALADRGRIDEAKDMLEAAWERYQSEVRDRWAALGMTGIAFASIRYCDITGDTSFIRRTRAVIEQVQRLRQEDERESSFDRQPPEEASYFVVAALGNLTLSPEARSPDDEARAMEVLSIRRRMLLPDSGGAWLHYPLSLDRVVGRLHAAAGQLEQAADRFDDAIDFCDSAGYVPEAAWSIHDRVKSALDDGVPIRRADAEKLLARGIELADSVGMVPVRERISAMQERLDEIRDPRRRRPVYAGGLTEREVEVLKELSAGRSNREIAEALFISQNTVIRHVSNILTKTGCSSRTEAAIWAERKGLIAAKSDSDG